MKLRLKSYVKERPPRLSSLLHLLHLQRQNQ
jgi:hypothetical protein